MVMIKKALQVLPGVLVFLLGSLAVIGWLVKIPILLRPNDAYLPIMFGGGVCFCLAGMALIWFPFSSRFSRMVQLICGSLLFLIATSILIQYVFDVDLAIDHWIDS